MNRIRSGASAFLISISFIIPSVKSFGADALQQYPGGLSRGNLSLLQQLEAARKADWDEAENPNVSTVRQGTFLNQMNKADRVIDELHHGLSPTQREINDALWVPPKHITPTERARLIEQLGQARQQDEQNEQRMLNGLTWGNSAAPEDTATFDQHKALIDRVMKDLEIGAPVHWTDIRRALAVPTSRY